MKTWKQITLIGILAILAIMVTACTKKGETQRQTATLYGTTDVGSELKNPDTSGAEILSPTIQIDRARGEILSKFEASFEYRDNDNPGEWIVLLTNIVLKELNFISINYDNETNSLFSDRVLFSRVEWRPDLAFRINTTVSEGIPSRGISYVDGKNIKRYFYINESGFDGSLSLSEFFPVVTRASVAPTPQQMPIDTMISGNLRDGGENWYNVRLSQSGLLVVQTMGDIDTYLEAYDEAKNLIGTDDDSGDGLNARLKIYAEAETTYLFKLRHLGNEGGAYRIWASSEPAPITEELRLNAAVSGEISEGGEYWYSVRVSRTCVVTVQTTGEIDTYLEAYDSSYKLITANDDGGENYNAKVEVLAVAGTNYLFKLRGYDAETIGSYSITASSKAIPRATALRFDAIVNGNIVEGEDYWYSVRAAESGYIAVETMGTTDTFLEGYDSSYTLLGTDDDSAGGGNAKLLISTQAGQTYLFRLRGYSSGVSGPYRIWSSFHDPH